jgi:hypothetical protein
MGGKAVAPVIVYWRAGCGCCRPAISGTERDLKRLAFVDTSKWILKGLLKSYSIPD